MNAITATQFIDLMNIGTSLRDGIAKVEDFFDRDAKPIGENAVAEKPVVEVNKKPVAKKSAAEVQQAKKPEEAQVPEKKEAEIAVPDVPDSVWDGEPNVNDEGEIIESSQRGPESFSDDDDMEDFFDHD